MFRGEFSRGDGGKLGLTYIISYSSVYFDFSKLDLSSEYENSSFISTCRDGGFKLDGF